MGNEISKNFESMPTDRPIFEFVIMSLKTVSERSDLYGIG